MSAFEIEVHLTEIFETEKVSFAKARQKTTNIINYLALTSQRPLIL